jgi:hypothetical protein
MLLHRRALQVPNRRGWFPLHLAAAVGSLRLVNALVAAERADIGAVTFEGHSVLRVAQLCGRSEVERRIVDLLAQPSRADRRLFGKLSGSSQQQQHQRPAPPPLAAAAAAVADEWADDDSYEYCMDCEQQPPAAGAAETKEADVADIVTWVCEFCTLENSALCARCEACKNASAGSLDDAMHRLAAMLSASGGVPAPAPRTTFAGDRSRLVMSEHAAYEESMAALQEAADVLRVPLRAVGVLMRKAKWDKDALAMRLMEDRAAVLAEAGVADEACGGGGGGDVAAAAPPLPPRELRSEVTCPACFDVKGEDAAAMTCGAWRRRVFGVLCVCVCACVCVCVRARVHTSRHALAHAHTHTIARTRQVTRSASRAGARILPLPSRPAPVV